MYEKLLEPHGLNCECCILSRLLTVLALAHWHPTFHPNQCLTLTPWMIDSSRKWPPTRCELSIWDFFSDATSPSSTGQLIVFSKTIVQLNFFNRLISTPPLQACRSWNICSHILDHKKQYSSQGMTTHVIKHVNHLENHWTSRTLARIKRNTATTL